jgi:xanthine dehydrogenase accessory factor
MAKKSISDERIFEELVARRRRRQPCALVILVETQGSVPAAAGCKMLVFGDGEVIGTIGGGGMEKEAVDQALAAIRSGRAQTLHVDLGAAPAYVCGGRAMVYIEPINSAPELIIAGAGHVGQALCQAAAFAGFSVVVVDDRPEFTDPAILPDASQVLTLDFTGMFSHLQVTAGSFIVCATRGHAHDYVVVRQALATPAGYIGLVGSLSKRGGFLQRLREEEGMADEALARLYTPVGINIGAISPREIAISIVAELIALRRNHACPNGFDAARGWGLPAHGTLQTAPADLR